MKALICALFLFAASLSQATVLSLITEELPPYAYKDKGKIVGASVEIVEALFKEAGVPYEIKIMPWKRAFELVKTKDACVFPIQRSQEREALFHWVSPVLITQTGFYAGAGKAVPVTTLKDAMPFKIGTYRGSAVEEYLVGQGFTVDATTVDEANVHKLKAGRLDLWAADTLSAAYVSKKNKVQLEEIMVYFTTLRALACNPNVSESLMEKLRTALQSIYQKGVVDAVIEKYRQ